MCYLQIGKEQKKQLQEKKVRKMGWRGWQGWRGVKNKRLFFYLHIFYTYLTFQKIYK